MEGLLSTGPTRLGLEHLQMNMNSSSSGGDACSLDKQIQA